MTAIERLPQNCKSCKKLVYLIHTGGRIAIEIPVETDPIAVGARGWPPFFEVRGQRFQQMWGQQTPQHRGYPIHSVHHCEPPKICWWCHHQHLPESTESGTPENANESENANVK
jgi:hypothetical protein